MARVTLTFTDHPTNEGQVLIDMNLVEGEPGDNTAAQDAAQFAAFAVVGSADSILGEAHGQEDSERLTEAFVNGDAPEPAVDGVDPNTSKFVD